MCEKLDLYAAPLVGLAAILMLAGAYGFEYLGDLPPCELCWWQRYAHMAAIPVALMAAALDMPARKTEPGGSIYAALAFFLLALIFATGTGIAAFHVGVEQDWWEGPTACTTLTLEGSLEDMFNTLVKAPVVRCDDIAWSLFGISMAGYNGLISLGLALYAGWATRNRLKRT